MALSGARRPLQELETTRKILILERSKGFQDQAVSGGLEPFIDRWQQRIARTGKLLSAAPAQIEKRQRPLPMMQRAG